MIDNHDDIDDHDDIDTVNQSMLPPSEELHHVTGRPPNLNWVRHKLYSQGSCVREMFRQVNLRKSYRVSHHY